MTGLQEIANVFLMLYYWIESLSISTGFVFLGTDEGFIECGGEKHYLWIILIEFWGSLKNVYAHTINQTQNLC